MTRWIRIVDADLSEWMIPGIDTPAHRLKGYVFDALTEPLKIGGEYSVIEKMGIAHSRREIKPHDVPNEEEVTDYVTNQYVYQGNGTHLKFERRDDEKIQRLTELVAKLIAGQPVTMQDVEAGQHD